MKRSKFNLTHLHSTTLDAGNLVPFLVLDTLPGDSFKLSLSSFVRAQPMLAPLMHEVDLITQYWYCPYRLLWSDWESFITGGSSGNEVFDFPYVDVEPSVGSLADYLGLPVGVKSKVSALPFRAYNKIWNTRYRDEDLQGEISESFAGGLDSTPYNLLRCAWKKDYFTTARTSTQRGSEISVPIGGVSSGSFQTEYKSLSLVSPLSFSFSESDLNLPPNSSIHYWFDSISSVSLKSFDLVAKTFSVSCSYVYRYSGVPTGPGSVGYRSFEKTFSFSEYVELPKQFSPVVSSLNASFSGSPGSYHVRFRDASFTIGSDNVVANGSENVPVLGNLDIRDLRLSSALQRYQEKSLEYGNRYEEFLQREFGVKPKDSRIQRPEYLGGGKSVLQISEVLQTAEGTQTGVGTMRGHGVGSFNSRPIKFFSPEHGVILGLLSIRPKAVYTQGIPRSWLKFTKLDYFIPELASIGMQEVFNKELYNDGTYTGTDKLGGVFGYQQRYAEYRSQSPKVTGEFRGVLDYWNMARKFESTPALNGSFITMNPTKRPFAEQTQHSFLAMLRNNVLAYRPVPKRSKNILK